MERHCGIYINSHGIEITAGTTNFLKHSFIYIFRLSMKTADHLQKSLVRSAVGQKKCMLRYVGLFYVVIMFTELETWLSDD